MGARGHPRSHPLDDLASLARPSLLAGEDNQRVRPEAAGPGGEAAELPKMSTGGEARLDREAEALENGREPIAQRGAENAVDVAGAPRLRQHRLGPPRGGGRRR